MSRTGRGGVLASAVLVVLASTPAGAAEPADVCLEFAPGVLAEAEWPALKAGVMDATGARSALFPAPDVSQTDSRLDVRSGHATALADRAGSACLEPGFEWTSRFGQPFLQAGAERMLAEAPTTPGIHSEVSIEWYPDDDRLRTVLRFAGPLDIPNGTCWVDDTLWIEGGAVMASGEQGVETSLFAEGACGRFFDHLPDGGAGEQAVTLLPAVVGLPSGGALRLVAEVVTVRDDAVVVSGRLERDGP